MVDDVIVAEVSLALGPMVVAFALLVTAGCEKVSRPAPTALALALAGVRVPDWAVQGLGLVEVMAALRALDAGVLGGTVVAVVFGGFALFTTRQVLQARATGEAADCGCFGDSSAPVGWTHVVVNLAFVAVGVATAVTDAPGLREAGYVDAIPATAVGLLAAVLVHALLTSLPRVQALRRTADA